MIHLPLPPGILARFTPFFQGPVPSLSRRDLDAILGDLHRRDGRRATSCAVTAAALRGVAQEAAAIAVAHAGCWVGTAVVATDRARANAARDVAALLTPPGGGTPTLALARVALPPIDIPADGVRHVLLAGSPDAPPTDWAAATEAEAVDAGVRRYDLIAAHALGEAVRQRIDARDDRAAMRAARTVLREADRTGWSWSVVRVLTGRTVLVARRVAPRGRWQRPRGEM